MTRSINGRRTTWVLAACTAVGISVTAHGQSASSPQSGTAVTPTAGAVALLGNRLDSDGIKGVLGAIWSNDPLVRAVAARIAAVTAHPPFAAPIAAAFEREQDPAAAAEQVRALLLIRGAAAVETIETRIQSLGGAAAGLLATWLADNQPQQVADLLPKVAPRVSQHRSELSRAVISALRKLEGRDDDSRRLLRAWLTISTPVSWGSMLRSLASEAGGVSRDAVLIEALASSDQAIADETVWTLVDAIAHNRPVSSAVVDAATSGLATDGQTAQPTWPEFGRELIARYAGKPMPDRSALLAAEARRHTGDARTVAMLRQSTAQEKATLKQILGKAYPGALAPAQQTPPGVSTMRLMPALWPGFLTSLFEAAGCKADRYTEFGVVAVSYRPDGRLAKISIEESGIKSACVQATTALARLTLEHRARKGPAGTREVLVLPIGAEYVDCASREFPDLFEAPRIGRMVPEPPRKVRDVKPDYPEAFIAKRVSGAVLLEGVISPTGCMSELMVIKSVAPGLDFAAIKATSAWRFEPARIDGTPISVMMTLTVNFTLD